MNTPIESLCVFDFDGTVSNLVPDRSAACLEPDCLALLEELAADPSRVVAVVSSRTLDDLMTRLPPLQVIKVGGSGLEWELPDGTQIHPPLDVQRRLEMVRTQWMPSFQKLERLPGVDLEDKRWSVAVHFREVPRDDRLHLLKLLSRLQSDLGGPLYFGPEVAEVPLLTEVSKALAMRVLVGQFAPAAHGHNLFYAGDDENDAQAMRWVLARGGWVCSVGNRIEVTGATRVNDPAELARVVRHLVGKVGALPWPARAEGLHG